MKVNLVNFLKSVATIPYILIKVDVPYMPKDFPVHYPNKDMDIITISEHYECFRHIIADFILDYPWFKCMIVDECHSILYRLLKNEELHYQFDLSARFWDLPDWFIQESIDKREKTKGYFVCPISYEIVYRIVAYQNKHKEWHLEYIKENKEQADIYLLERLSLKELFYEYIK